MGSYMGAKGKCRGEFGQKWGTTLPKNRENGKNREYRSFFGPFYGTTLFLWAET